MKPVRIIGAPISLASPERGASLGPDAIRLAGLREKLTRLEKKIVDDGNLPPLEEPDHPKSFPKGEIRYLEEVTAFQSMLKERVRAAFEDGHLPMVLGGDHSIAIGSLAAAAAFHAAENQKAGLIWFDAHADLNTEETSPSGNIHGMSLAVALGKGNKRLVSLFEGRSFDPERTVIFGVRSVDPLEGRIVKEMGVTVYTMKDIDARGAQTCIGEALEKACAGKHPLHLSFDVDVVDSHFAEGTATAVPGGLTLREAHLFMELVAESGCLQSLDVVEINPLLDTRNRTSKLAVLLLESVFGKVIY